MSRRGDHNVTAVEITTGDSCGRLSPLIVMDRLVARCMMKKDCGASISPRAGAKRDPASRSGGSSGQRRNVLPVFQSDARERHATQSSGKWDKLAEIKLHFTFILADNALGP